jgi:hypothetical protein
MKTDSRCTLIILFLSILLTSCLSGTEVEQRLKPLRQIAAETPVHPRLKEISSGYIAKNTHANLTYNYRSEASFDEIKSFYVKELIARGWSGPREETGVTGMRDLIFHKGDYTIIVTDGREATSDWDYGIYYGWHQP